MSDELSGETGESDHIKLEPAGFSRSAFGLYLICETCNEIHSYIYEYISTYRPTFFLNSTREIKRSNWYGLMNIHCIATALVQCCFRTMFIGYLCVQVVLV